MNSPSSANRPGQDSVPGIPLLRSTALRLAVGYVLGYAVLCAVMIAAVSWSSMLYVDTKARTQLRAELEVLIRLEADDGAEGLRDAVRLRSQAPSPSRRFYLLVDADGEPIAGNLRFWPEEEAIDADRTVRSVWIDEEALTGGAYEDDAFLPVIAHAWPDGRRLLVALGAEQAAMLQTATDYLSDGLGVAVALGLLMGITLSLAIRRRIGGIHRAANEIIAGRLSRRVPTSRWNDEFDVLAQHLNTMLDRNQLLIRGMREVTDNIAHDLRSPLSRLRSRMEVALLETRTQDEYRQVLAQGVEDADALIRTFNALLQIARAEAGPLNGEAERVDLAALVRDLTEFYAPLAEAKRQALNVDADGTAWIDGNRKLLAQAVGNLIENASKYAPAGTPITVQVCKSELNVELIISDAGPGIPSEQRARVLQRFVRLDTARSTEGNGLGLSLVKAVAQLHDADLRLGDADPGLRVHLRFARAVN